MHKKQNKLFLLLGFVLLIVAGWWFWQNSRSAHSGFTQLQLGNQTLQVELAVTSAQHQQGLSGRSEIGSDGLLFIFPEPTIPSFWMKEMQFDLDMIWIRDGQVVDITQNVPAPDPNTPLSQLPMYRPNTEVTAILEVPAGFVEQHGIEIGERAVW